jgi:hypothetical protein
LIIAPYGLRAFVPSYVHKHHFSTGTIDRLSSIKDRILRATGWENFPPKNKQQPASDTNKQQGGQKSDNNSNKNKQQGGGGDKGKPEENDSNKYLPFYIAGGVAAALFFAGILSTEHSPRITWQQFLNEYLFTTLFFTFTFPLLFLPIIAQKSKFIY